MLPALIVYHRADFDGVCSAAIAKKFVPDAELWGIDYGDPFPWAKVWPAEIHEVLPTRYKFGGKTLVDETSGSVECRGKRTVYLLDFSLPPEDMKKLAACCDPIWCDHHKSALDANMGLEVLGYQTSALAGCELTWLWFTRTESERWLVRGSEPTAEQVARIPEAVRLLGRYDVWDAENPDWPRIEAFQFGLRAVPGILDPEHDAWAALVAPYGDPLSDGTIAAVVGTAVDRGLAVLSYRDQEAKALCADGAQEFCAFRTGSGGLNWFFGDDCHDVLARDDGKRPAFTGIALNTLQRGSWLFKGVWDQEKHDAMCIYGQLKDGRWRVSLYSTKPEVDCGAIAKSLGGGGHRGAAGFICEKLPWDDAT